MPYPSEFFGNVRINAERHRPILSLKAIVKSPTATTVRQD
jgi:hypothetical protein